MDSNGLEAGNHF